MVVVAFLSGCSSVKVERDESIALVDALKEVVAALNEMSKI